VPDYQYDLSETCAAVDPLQPGPGPYAPHILEERLREALGLSAQLVEQDPYIPRYLVSRAQVSHQLASLLEQGGRLDEAERLHTAALQLQRSLASQFPEALYHKVRLGEFGNDLARLLLLRHRPAEAQPLLEEAIALLTPALKGSQELWVLHALLARSYGALEAALKDLGNERAATQARQKAEEHREAMRSSRPRGSDREVNAPSN
jgi:tetratricopeptide (TPR) repeat protein